MLNDNVSAELRDWSAILDSYCITPVLDQTGKYTGIGEGCNYEDSHKHYNLEITNEEILEFGSGLDISSINQYEDRIAYAVEWVQEGVPEFVAT